MVAADQSQFGANVPELRSSNHSAYRCRAASVVRFDPHVGGHRYSSAAVDLRRARRNARRHHAAARLGSVLARVSARTVEHVRALGYLLLLLDCDAWVRVEPVAV